MIYTQSEYLSPVGKIYIIQNEKEEIVSLDFEKYESRMNKLVTKYHSPSQIIIKDIYSEIKDALDTYFDGHLNAFKNIKVDINGTKFQNRIWNKLTQIPAGNIWSYGKLAHEIGNDKAYRAVGYANSLNPIAIIIPCQRVTGTNGKLTGYAGGLDRKKWLLEHERNNSKTDLIYLPNN